MAGGRLGYPPFRGGVGPGWLARVAWGMADQGGGKTKRGKVIHKDGRLA